MCFHEGTNKIWNERDLMEPVPAAMVVINAIFAIALVFLGILVLFFVLRIREDDDV